MFTCLIAEQKNYFKSTLSEDSIKAGSKKKEIMHGQHKVCYYVILGLTLVVIVLYEIFQKRKNVLGQKSQFLITKNESKIDLETLNFFYQNFLELVSYGNTLLLLLLFHYWCFWWIFA